MVQFASLEPGRFHLIQLTPDGKPELVYVLMASETSLLLEFESATKERAWFRKSDSFFELIETFSDEAASLYQMITKPQGDNELPDWAAEDDEEDLDRFWSNQENDPDLPFMN
jgi:hypothetical protein